MKITDAGDTVVVTGATTDQKKRLLEALNEKSPNSTLELITRKQTSELLGGVCSMTIRRYELRGLINPIRFTARRVRYNKAQIMELARKGAPEVQL